MTLSGNVAVVTGGGRGIGRAVCERFVAEGAEVVALSRRAPDSEAQPVSGGTLAHVECDVAEEGSVDRAFASILERYGRIDVLVNNAGVTRGAMIHKEDLTSFRHVLDVNLIGTWLCTRRALAAMRAHEGGSIVNIGSMAGKLGNLGQGAYAAAKAGVVALTKATAREGAGRGIRCNAIQPGLIQTDMTASMPAEAWERVLETIPLGRPGTAGEVASVAAFLASDESSYLTGCIIDVAGGRGM